MIVSIIKKSRMIYNLLSIFNVSFTTELTISGVVIYLFVPVTN